MRYASLAALAMAIHGAVLLGEQSSDVHQWTAVPSNARFEIVQSELEAKWTFRLDRFTGHVSQLVRTTEDDNRWEAMPIVEDPQVASPNRPRFQIFTSGISAKHTFMIDTDTGRTWRLVTVSNTPTDGGGIRELNEWQPFAK